MVYWKTAEDQQVCGWNKQRDRGNLINSSLSASIDSPYSALVQSAVLIHYSEGKGHVGRGTLSNEHMLHHREPCSALTPFGAHKHVAEEERPRALTTNDGWAIWSSSRYRLPVGGMCGEMDGRLKLRMDGWMDRQTDRRTDRQYFRRKKKKELQQLKLHGVIMLRRSPFFRQQEEQQTVDRHDSETLKQWRQQQSVNKSYLFSLEIGLSLDLQSEGDSSDAPEEEEIN